MIETEQTALVDAGIVDVWNFVQDIARWAEIMPGYRECEIIDEHASRWTLKVGVSGLVRTVKVAVNVDEWNGPQTVRFTYKLTGDPVHGGGVYHAEAKGANQTEITLKVRVVGSGPMAPMWEAMGKPLLPKFAQDFANQLKSEIEKTLPDPGPANGVTIDAATIRRSGLLVRLWQRLFGRKRG